MASGASEGEALFKANCIACHQPSTSDVGPSLFEIAKIYKKDKPGIVLWAMKPGRKRKDGIAMPPMAYVGEKNLELIAEHMLKAGAKATKGKRAKKPAFKEKLGVLQRACMPNSSPASIAVTLPNGISYCWDADNCYIRYFWNGGADFVEHLTGSGKSIPTLDSPAFYTVPKQPFFKDSSDREFLGYDLGDDGLPKFRYRLGTYEIQEYVESRGQDVLWHYKIKGNGVLRYDLPEIEGYKVSVSEGKVDRGVLTLNPNTMKKFTISLIKEGARK